MKVSLISICLILFTCTIGISASAGNIFLMGDLTPAFDLTKTPPHTKVDEYNKELFQRFRSASFDSGSIYILYNCLSPLALYEIGDFYSSAGNIVRLEGPIEPVSLHGVSLLIIAAPETALADQEVAAIRKHLSSGGDLLLLGEPAVRQVGNKNINLFLQELESAMRLDDNIVKRTGRVTRISSDPLVEGIPWITIGASNGVSGGTPLAIDDQTNVPILAYEYVAPKEEGI